MNSYNKKMAVPLTSLPFSESPLTPAQIDSNYTWKNIRQTGTRLDEKVFVNTTDDQLMVTKLDSTLTPDNTQDVIMVGTALTNTRTPKTVNIGHRNVMTGTTASVNIGMDSNIINRADLPDERADNNISIGDGNITGAAGVGAPDTASALNVIIGNANTTGTAIAQGFRNVKIGHDLRSGNGVNNTICIATNPLLTPLVSGAICLGGGATASSGLPKFQLQSDGLVTLVNSTFDGAYAEQGIGVNEVAAVQQGFLRMRYQGFDIKIPFLQDTNAAIPGP
jgi:hypothetical protein